MEFPKKWDGSCPTCRQKIQTSSKVSNSAVMPGYTPESLAEKFHTLYEAFAPEYSYETREDSAVPWADVPEQNKKLMIRVCRTILGGV